MQSVPPCIQRSAATFGDSVAVPGCRNSRGAQRDHTRTPNMNALPLAEERRTGLKVIQHALHPRQSSISRQPSAKSGLAGYLTVFIYCEQSFRDIETVLGEIPLQTEMAAQRACGPTASPCVTVCRPLFVCAPGPTQATRRPAPRPRKKNGSQPCQRRLR